jgi:hypothetical protein
MRNLDMPRGEELHTNRPKGSLQSKCRLGNARPDPASDSARKRVLVARPGTG